MFRHVTLRLVTIVFLMALSGSLHAATVTVVGAAGYIHTGSTDCVISYNSVSSGTGGGICVASFPILIPMGSTLSSVRVYYFDNSGLQSMAATLSRVNLSTNAVSALVTSSDSTTATTVQYSTLSYGSSLSSSYAYYVNVTLANGTELVGIKITY